MVFIPPTELGIGTKNTREAGAVIRGTGDRASKRERGYSTVNRADSNSTATPGTETFAATRHPPHRADESCDRRCSEGTWSLAVAWISSMESDRPVSSITALSLPLFGVASGRHVQILHRCPHGSIGDATNDDSKWQYIVITY
jgi:hypothetical protein